MVAIILLNPDRNHAFSETYSRMRTGVRQISKLEFIYENTHKIKPLFNDWVFAEMPKIWPKNALRKFEISYWQKKYKLCINEPVDYDNDVLFLSTKDLKYGDKLVGLVKRFRKCAIFVDDHLFSTARQFEKLCKAIPRLIILSVASIKNNPFYNFSELRNSEFVVGWPIEKKFKSYQTLAQRNHTCLVLGTLTYRNYSGLLDTELDKYDINCVHPDRELLYDEAPKILFYDCRIPKRDFRNRSLLTRLSGYYENRNYIKLDLVKELNRNLFAIFPPLYNQLPCLGMLEVIACGAILVGTDEYAYHSLGLIPNENYISLGSKFSKKNLNDFAKSYRNNFNILETMRNNNETFIEKFTKTSVNYNIQRVLENAK